MTRPRFTPLVCAVIALAAVVDFCAVVTTLITPSPTFAGEPEAPDAFQQQVRPLLERYCADCHMNGESGGGNRPRSLRQSGGGRQGRPDLAPRARCAPGAHHAAGRRCPSRRSQELGPDRRAGSKTTSWPPSAPSRSSSAPVVIRRLNRQEYNNTIRDLLGLDLHLADGFPAR